MTRCGWSMLVLVFVGCHPPAPAPSVQPKMEPPPPAELPTEPAEPPEVVVREPVPMPMRELPPGVEPPGVDASQTACEQSCAEVHDCTLVIRAYTAAAAAAIELGCLGACLHAPQPTASLFDCTRPTTIEPATCAAFLECLGPVWPRAGETSIPTVVEHTSGCERTCELFATCANPSATADEIAQCVDGCQKLLTPEQERRFGTCADQPDCEQLIACVLSTPGA